MIPSRPLFIRVILRARYSVLMPIDPRHRRGPSCLRLREGGARRFRFRGHARNIRHFVPMLQARPALLREVCSFRHLHLFARAQMDVPQIGVVLVRSPSTEVKHSSCSLATASATCCFEAIRRYSQTSASAHSAPSLSRHETA